MCLFPAHSFRSLFAALAARQGVLCLALMFLLSSCSGAGGAEGKTDTLPSSNGKTKASAGEKPAAFVPDPAACRSDSILRVDGGAGERRLVLRGGLAIPRINFNEQTDAGDVAKPGMTVCLADFPLSASAPWARPPSGEGVKIELRLFTGDNRPLEAGVYRSARQGSLQLGPMLYIDGETHPFAFPKMGRVLIHRVDEEVVCGQLELQTISGLSMQGAFSVPVVEELNR